MKLSKEQIKKIHVLKARASLTDEYYREIMQSKFNRNSCLELSEAQATILINTLSRLVKAIEMASDKQKNKLDILFKRTHRNKLKKEFIKEKLGYYKNEKNLTKKECSKLIYILEEIEKWQEGEKQ